MVSTSPLHPAHLSLSPPAEQEQRPRRPNAQLNSSGVDIVTKDMPSRGSGVCREFTAVSCRVQAAGEWRSMWGGEEGHEWSESRGISRIE
jgi:hypothetical protein